MIKSVILRVCHSNQAQCGKAESVATEFTYLCEVYVTSVYIKSGMRSTLNKTVLPHLKLGAKRVHFL